MKRTMYTTNPFLPKVRMQAVMLVRRGWSMRKVARHLGVNPSTVSRWVKKAPVRGCLGIPTLPSKPRHHPKTISNEVRQMIIDERIKTKRCGNVIHRKLQNDGVNVSLSTVNRVLDRGGYLKKKSKWKRFHRNTPRILPDSPGDLIQLDTIHLFPLIKTKYKKWYIYTLLDVNSRWAYAKAFGRINTYNSLNFVKEAKEFAPFDFNCVQTDNGQEFSTYFSHNLKIKHRHTRVRKPTDNAYIERFNRTIQEESITHVPETLTKLNRTLKEYINHYNNERMHMGIDYQTPNQKLGVVLQRY